MSRELTAAERYLFSSIASDIGMNSDKYRRAGQWLDRYYNNDKLCWKKRKAEIISKISRLERKASFTEADESELDELKEELESKDEGVAFVPMWLRLAYALEDLWLDYRSGCVMAENDARAVLLIAWIATDPEANESDLGLTKLADLPWKTDEDDNGPSRQGLMHDLFLLRKPTSFISQFHEYDEQPFLKFIFTAWETLYTGTIEGEIVKKFMLRSLTVEKKFLDSDGQDETKAHKDFLPENKKDTQWKPPKGYIGSKTIVADYEIPRTTLQGWAERDNAKVTKDKQTGENYYQKKWLEKRLKSYKPRPKV